MVEDPYKVLGIPRDASKEEIKRAYRKMGKKYHPDLNPNNPEAEKKMVEINEAYDMLSNPEKYQNRTTSQRNTSQTYGNQSYQRNPYENTSNQGMEREYGEFWGFDFEDLFGFGTRNQSSYKQNYQATDTEQFRQIVDFINMKRYDYANQILQKVVSSERSARWYYLSALTNQGLGNQIRAMEDIKCALQMEPDNVSYKQLYGELNRSSSTYQDVGKEFQKAAEGMHKYCMGFCMLNFFCTFCRC